MEANVDYRALRIRGRFSANPWLTVKLAAKSECMSESHLRKLIYIQLGMTVREIKQELQKKRMHEARHALIETCDQIKLIQVRAGYRDASSFSRYFKKIFQRSPLACRRARM